MPSHSTGLSSSSVFWKYSAMPKSVMYTILPFRPLPMRKLLGFTSLCTIPFECTYSKR